MSSRRAQIYFLGNLWSCMCFGDLNSIIDVKSQLTNGNLHLKIRYFMNQWIDIHQNCMDMIIMTDLRHIKFLVSLILFSRS